MEDRVLFKNGYLVLMLRCVDPIQANYVIQEIHMGSCGMHSALPSMVRKAMRQGYYHLTMHEDAKEEILKCDSCQIHSSVPKLPKTLMTSIMAPWPFYQWGMDILGPLSQAAERVKFVIVAIDYFTKLGRDRSGWVDELSNVVWAYRMSIKQSNGETPFSLTYGSKAVIPAEIGMPTYQTMMIIEGFNEKELRLNLDLLQERREMATIREARYKTKMEQYYNKRVHLTNFKPGEFVF
nr:reverse transcriptase domain-containing protein [Tanacetum cinerariifolium]